MVQHAPISRPRIPDDFSAIEQLLTQVAVGEEEKDIPRRDDRGFRRRPVGRPHVNWPRFDRTPGTAMEAWDILKHRLMSDEYQRIELIIGTARRRWSADEKMRIVSESLESGETISSVARGNGVAANLLYRLAPVDERRGRGRRGRG